MSKKQPNVLFFFVDQQRWDTCGCYGQELDLTPNLDRMAAEGTRFDRAYSCQPVCGPARAVLQTGKFATEVECPTNHCVLPFHEDTIARRLRRAGYEAAYIGKWHLASCGPRGGEDDFRTRAVPPERRGGYDDFWLAADTLEFTSHGYDGHMFDTDGNRRDFPEGRYRVDAQTDWALEYLDTRSKEKPFFLFLSYIEPHHQNDRNCYEGPHGSKSKFADYPIPKDLEGTEGDWRENYPDYLGCIHSLDENLGRIRAKLEELGIADDTVIIYTSDHGSHFRTRNSEYKRSCHEASVRIPMIINGPGFRGGHVVADLAGLIDLPATILDAAGLDVPDSFQGRALQDAVAGKAPDWPEEVFIQISESHCGRALVTKRWKYSIRALYASPHDTHADRYVEDFLYDLESDPHERTNLVDSPEYTEIRRSLRGRLLKCMETANEPPAIIRTVNSRV